MPALPRGRPPPPGHRPQTQPSGSSYAVTDLAVYEPSLNLPARTGVPGSDEFDSWIAVASDVIKLSNVIFDTPFVPDGLRGSAPAVAAAILAGRELGLPPLTSLANIHVIKGKPSLAAVLMRALIQAQGHQWRDIEVTDTRAVIEARRRNEPEWTRVSFTADQAKTAKITLGDYPQDKLYARATPRLARRKFADVIAGMPYSSEELEDGPADVLLAGESYQPLSEAGKPAEGNGAAPAPARPRTAQRKPRAQAPAAAAPDEKAPAAAGLPPLPGEDDPEPGPAKDNAPAWVGMIVQHFTRLGVEDRDERLIMTTRIAGRPEPVETTKDLNDLERKRVLDTLSRCKDRGQLIALMNEGDKPDA